MNPLYIQYQHDQLRHIQKTPFKMKILIFDGTYLLGWIFKITHFFNFHNMPEEKRISISSFYMKGPALNLYPRMYNKNQPTSLTQFLDSLQMHFASSQSTILEKHHLN